MKERPAKNVNSRLRAQKDGSNSKGQARMKKNSDYRFKKYGTKII